MKLKYIFIFFITCMIALANQGCAQDVGSVTNLDNPPSYKYVQEFRVYQIYTYNGRQIERLICDKTHATNQLDSVASFAFLTEPEIIFQGSFQYICSGFRYEQKFIWEGKENYVSSWVIDPNNQISTAIYCTINSIYNITTKADVLPALQFNVYYTLTNTVSLSN